MRMEYHLKQRLVGAAVLIGIAVIFIPMLLDGPVDQDTPPRATGIPLSVPEPQRQAPPRETTRETPPPDTTVQAEAAPATGSDPRPSTQPAGDWAVQLGSFSSRDNADALAGRLEGMGFDSFVQRIEAANGTMYRVRIGPVAVREDAERLAARVQDVIGERAVVVTHP